MSYTPQYLTHCSLNDLRSPSPATDLTVRDLSALYGSSVERVITRQGDAWRIFNGVNYTPEDTWRVRAGVVIVEETEVMYELGRPTQRVDTVLCSFNVDCFGTVLITRLSTHPVSIIPHTPSPAGPLPVPISLDFARPTRLYSHDIITINPSDPNGTAARYEFTYTHLYYATTASRRTRANGPGLPSLPQASMLSGENGRVRWVERICEDTRRLVSEGKLDPSYLQVALAEISDGGDDSSEGEEQSSGEETESDGESEPGSIESLREQVEVLNVYDSDDHKRLSKSQSSAK